MSRAITWNPEKLKAVKAALARADEARQTSFKITLPGEREEIELDCGYCRHMVDYIEQEFRRHPPNNEGKEGE